MGEGFASPYIYPQIKREVLLNVPIIAILLTERSCSLLHMLQSRA